MAERIFDNKSRKNLLTFFLKNPKRAFFVGEIKGVVGSRNLNADLNVFVKKGVLLPFSKKGSKFYTFNRKFPIDLRFRTELLKSTDKFETEVDKSLKRIGSLKYAVLSGVFSADKKLECDLLLIGKIPNKTLSAFIKKVQKMIGQEINYAVMTAEEFDLRKNSFDHFIKDIFENDHHVVVNKLK